MSQTRHTVAIWGIISSINSGVLYILNTRNNSLSQEKYVIAISVTFFVIVYCIWLYQPRLDLV